MDTENIYILIIKTMKLTRNQWRQLEKMPIKERVERLEERISDLDNRYYHHVMDEINEDTDKKSMRIIITSMIFL